MLRVDLVDTAAAGEPSLTSFLRLFTRRLVLQPGQRQVVRVMVTMPAAAANGEYWGRVLVKSRGGEPPIEQSQGGVRMQLSLETTLATAVFFQKGDVKTGISISGADARRMGDSVQFTLDLKRENNSAFLGHVRVELVNAFGCCCFRVRKVSSSKRTASSCALRTANSNGVNPDFECEPTAAPAAINERIASTLPSPAASISAVWPRKLSAALTSAPCASSASTAAVWPFSAALMSGV